MGDPMSSAGANTANMPASANSGAMNAATAVRTAFAADPAFASSDVQVMAQGDGVVLKGTVVDSKAKMAMEKSAKTAAGDIKIDNQLTLKPEGK